MTAFFPLASIGTLPLLILFAIFALICILLILVILMQKGKGSGLAGLVGGVAASDNMGTPEAQKDLSRYTRNIAIVFFVLCIGVSMVSTRCGGPVETQVPFTGAVGAEAEVLAEEEAVDQSPPTLDETEVSPEVIDAVDAAEEIGEVTAEQATGALSEFAAGVGETVEEAVDAVRDAVTDGGDDAEEVIEEADTATDDAADAAVETTGGEAATAEIQN